jgi:hypothetical protein
MKELLVLVYGDDIGNVLHIPKATTYKIYTSSKLILEITYRKQKNVM